MGEVHQALIGELVNISEVGKPFATLADWRLQTPAKLSGDAGRPYNLRRACR